MRKLPPFSSMRAFEAAARLGSFKHAAAELSVSPTAISHQIRQLERRCGKTLFHRQTRKVALTQEGEDFSNSLGSAFDLLANAYETLRTDTHRAQVTLGGGPLIVSRWLLKLLPDFWSDHPDIDLWLHHSPLQVWQQIDRYDLAIAWGDGKWSNVESLALLNVEVTPVISPTLGEKIQLKSPADLLKLPLLHHRTTKDWQQWFKTVGVQTDEKLPGTVFEDANILLQAAIAHRGTALGFSPLINEDLETGKLVCPFKSSIKPEQAYYLIRQKNTELTPPVRAAWDWLASQ